MAANLMDAAGCWLADGDIRIGVEIWTRTALSDEFESASGQYFDGDSGHFALPHRDALDPQKSAEIVGMIEAALVEIAQL